VTEFIAQHQAGIAIANYRFVDFLRIGVPMNIIVGIATCVAIALLMPLSK
jgi:di/tricarboxylate transporter